MHARRNDFAQHLDRQVHGLHCSFIPGMPAEASAGLLKLATQGDFLTPTCPSCSVKMTSRKSTAEGRKFWGCRNYPLCKETFSGIHPPA